MTREEFIRALALEFAKQGKLFHDIINDTTTIAYLTDKMDFKKGFTFDDVQDALAEVMKQKRWAPVEQSEETAEKTGRPAGEKKKRETPKYHAIWKDSKGNVIFKDEDVSEEPYTEEELNELKETLERQEAEKDGTTEKEPVEPELNELGYRKNYDDVTRDDILGDYDEYKEKTKWGRSFEMTPVEYLRWQKFQEEHRDCQRRPDGLPRFGAIGGGMSVTFAPTGLGNLVSVRCGHCGTTVDITDTDCW